MDWLEGAFGAFSLLMQPEWNFFLATMALVALLTYWKKEAGRLPAMFAVIALSFLLALALKQALGVARPCAISPNAMLACPDTFSLPSAHTTVAFGIVAASVGFQTFPIYFIWALLVALSRLFLGVHTIFDVSAGIAIAIFSAAVISSLGISDGAYSSKGLFTPLGPAHRKRASDEFARKIVQAIIGLSAAATGYFFGLEAALLLVTYCLAFGIVLFHLKSYRMPFPIIDSVLAWLERPGDPAGFGALNFFAGLLIALSLIPSPGLALSMVYILAVSDGAAAFFGSGAKKGLPHHPYKTYRGSLAFFAFALPSFFLGGLPALAAAVFATIIESLPLGLDDNLTIPWAGVIVYCLRIFA
jgi:undecaprenyl-diphosphatase